MGTSRQEVLNGRYRIIRFLGEGGTGSVHLAADLALEGRPLALKKLNPSFIGDREEASLKDEFRAMSQLRHPNLVEVHDYDQDRETGQHFFTMEYIEGKNLAEEGGSPPGGELTSVVPLLVQICRGIEYIHSRGVIHNDLKAQNVMITAGEPRSCKVMDFGFATRAGDAAGPLRGTIQYMAPELLKGGRPDRLSDIYSLGVIFYLALTGRLPFDGEASEVLRRAPAEAPEDPRSLRPGIPEGLERLVLAMLSKDRSERPSSAAAVIGELSRVMETAYEIDTPATLSSYVRTGAFVGRVKERDRLVTMIDRAVAAESGSAAVITGESGIGKSRLIRQVRYEAQMRGCAFALGQCYEGSATSYQPFIQILRQALPGAERDEEIAPLFSEKPASALDDPRQAQRRAIDAAVGSLLEASDARPLILCIEDLQWSDTASIQMLEHLARNGFRAKRLVVLVSYRSEDAATAPLASALPRLRRAADWQAIELSRLSAGDVSAMLAGMFGLESSPDSLVELIVRETEGNPFFVQVAVESLLDEPGPAAQTVAERLAALEGLGAIEFPRSATDAIGRRLSRLDEPESRVMEALAVAERPVNQRLLVRLLGTEVSAARVSAAVTRLLRRRLAAREIDPAGAIRIRTDHVRIRDHVHEAMDWGRRRELHGRYGLLLEQEQAEGRPVDIEHLAYHFINSKDVERALSCAEKAGLHAMQLCASERAIDFFEHALELIPPSDSARRLRVQLDLGDAYRQARDFTKAVEAYERLIKGARGAGDREMAWTGSSRMVDAQSRGGNTDEARRTAERLIRTLEAEGEKANRADCILVLANMAAGRGQLDQAEDLNRQALELRRSVGDHRGEAACLNNLGLIDMVRGSTEKGRALLEESLERWRSLSDSQRASEVLGNLGVWHRRNGDLASAEACCGEAAELGRRNRDRYQMAMTQSTLAAVHRAQGKLDRARLEARNAVDNGASIGHDAAQCEGLDLLGMIERDLGRHAEAVACHEQAAGLARRAGLPGQEAYAHASLALDRLAQGGNGSIRAAHDAIRKAAKLAGSIDSPRLKARLHEASARAALADSDTGTALENAPRAVEAAIADGLAEHLAAAELLHAECLLAAGKDEDASRAAERAETLAGKHSLPDAKARAHVLMASVEQRAGRGVAEKKHLSRAAEAIKETAEMIEDEAIRMAFLADQGRADALRRAAALAPRRIVAPALQGERSAVGALSALYEITEVINSISDLDAMLARLLDVGLGIVGAERGLIVLVDEETGDQRVAAARDLEEETMEDALSYSHNVVQEAANGHVIVALDTQSDDHFRKYKSVGLYSIKSLMCVPMKMRNRILGTVYVDSRIQGIPFREEDLRFLEAFSNLAASAVEQARLHEKLALENVYLKREAGERNHYQNIIGKSTKMQAVYDLCEKVSSSPLPVLIQGESGTGKELIARALHYSGPRKDRRFVTENVAAIPETLLESVMFGHARGSFTGADRDHKGLFEAADGGTLFLDEIGDMSLPMQSKLLRALQEGEIRPVGGKHVRKVDVRVISASNKDLDRLVREGSLREDLYFRINVVRITLPALRERKDDIPLLVDHFLQKVARRSGEAPKRMEVGALQLLLRYSWPGNVRELENEVQRLAVLSPGEVITQRDVMESGELFEKITSLEEKDSFTPLEELERRQIEKALMEAGGHRGRAAELLGISRATIFRKLRKFGISH